MRSQRVVKRIVLYADGTWKLASGTRNYFYALALEDTTVIKVFRPDLETLSNITIWCAAETL
jgi:hypothetical protein